MNDKFLQSVTKAIKIQCGQKTLNEREFENKDLKRFICIKVSAKGVENTKNIGQNALKKRSSFDVFACKVSEEDFGGTQTVGFVRIRLAQGN